MGLKRLFIAIDIPGNIREAAAEHILHLRRKGSDVRVSWEKPGKLHITLKYLGNTEPEKVVRVHEAVALVAESHEPFSLTLEGTGVFPNPSKPRILWLGAFDEGGASRRIAEELDAECCKLGYPIETRRFSPHLTIARVREPEKGRDIAAIHSNTAFGPNRMLVKHLVMYESQLGLGGSVYSVIFRHPLKAKQSGI